MAGQNGKANGTATVEGVVAVVNDGGLRLAGQEAWLNFSRFAEVPRPRVGAKVRLQVAQGKWVKALEVLSDPQPETPAEPASPEPDRLAVRRFALALAVRVYCTDAGSTWATSENILALASAFEGWLLRA